MTNRHGLSAVRDTPRAVDRHLEVYDVRSAHATEVNAPVAVTYQALQDMDLAKSIPVMALFALRGLPHLLTGKARPSRSFTLQTFLEAGFTILEDRPPKEMVMGAVGRFWRPTSGLVEVTPEEFASFDEPGYAKAVMAFTVEEHEGLSLLSTETRVVCTDASALSMFSLYWRLIGPFSGLIRRIMLDQVKLRAEGA